MNIEARIWKRAGIGIWEGSVGRKGREICCNYIVISNKPNNEYCQPQESWSVDN